MSSPATPGGFAPAKVNLCLHAGERQPDGYHPLVSLVVFADIGDRLSLHAAPGMSLTISGPFAAGLPDGPDNLVLAAAHALRDWAMARGHDAPPVGISLEKNLPLASGVGGGSSDAAATLRLLASHWALPVTQADLLAIAARLGADVPMCLAARPLIATGTGGDLSPVDGLPDMHLVLVNPGIAVATADVFRALGVRSGTAPLALPPPAAGLRGLAAFLDRTMNDLAAPARKIAPAILEAERALVLSEGCLFARMSGSGATCFGIFGTASDAALAATHLSGRHPAWWVRACGLHRREA